MQLYNPMGNYKDLYNITIHKMIFVAQKGTHTNIFV